MDHPSLDNLVDLLKQWAYCWIIQVLITSLIYSNSELIDGSSKSSLDNLVDLLKQWAYCWIIQVLITSLIYSNSELIAGSSKSW